MPDTIDRSGCNAKRHGDQWAYKRDCRCSDARQKARRYTKLLSLGLVPPAYIDVTGSRRRIQALYAMGWNGAEIARRLGLYSRTIVSKIVKRQRWIHRDLAAKIAALYEELGDTIGPSRLTMTRARSRGCQPPMYWEGIDIDDPNAAPDTEDETAAATEDTTQTDDAPPTVDEMVVERLVVAALRNDRRQLPPEWTRDERRAAITRLYAFRTDTAIAEAWEMSDRTILRDRKEMGLIKADESVQQEKRAS